MSGVRRTQPATRQRGTSPGDNGALNCDWTGIRTLRYGKCHSEGAAV